MRFLVDECLFDHIVRHLESDGHHVTWAAGALSITSDRDLLALATREGAVLVSEDQDFGELVFPDQCPAVVIVIVKVGEFALGFEEIGAQVAATVRDRVGRSAGFLTVIEPGLVRQRPLPGGSP